MSARHPIGGGSSKELDAIYVADVSKAIAELYGRSPYSAGETLLAIRPLDRRSAVIRAMQGTLPAPELATLLDISIRIMEGDLCREVN